MLLHSVMNLYLLGYLDHFHAVEYLYDLFKTSVLYLFPVDSVEECNQEVKTSSCPKNWPWTVRGYSPPPCAWNADLLAESLDQICQGKTTLIRFAKGRGRRRRRSQLKVWVRTEQANSENEMCKRNSKSWDQIGIEMSCSPKLSFIKKKKKKETATP